MVLLSFVFSTLLVSLKNDNGRFVVHPTTCSEFKAIKTVKDLIFNWCDMFSGHSWKNPVMVPRSQQFVRGLRSHTSPLWPRYVFRLHAEVIHQ